MASADKQIPKRLGFCLVFSGHICGHCSAILGKVAFSSCLTCTTCKSGLHPQTIRRILLSFSLLPEGAQGSNGANHPLPSFPVASWDVGVVLPEQKDQEAVGMGGHVTLGKTPAYSPPPVPAPSDHVLTPTGLVAVMWHLLVSLQ